jgi:site-specific DNA-methyltransferase (adenine-specific)
MAAARAEDRAVMATAYQTARPGATNAPRCARAQPRRPADEKFAHSRAAGLSAHVANPRARAIEPSIAEWWRSPAGEVRLFHGDCLERLDALAPESVDVVFADPPYFLSNGGTTCQSGRRVSVDKGGWDKSRGIEENHAFNRRWLEACRRVLTPDGTIWVSGTSHVIYSVGFAMQQVGLKLLNEVVWEKPNPPPNLSCRYFTHSTETILWAAKSRKSRHYFDYHEMRSRNGDRQMKTVWRMTAPGRAEKLRGKHPTQKPLALLDRILVASCPPDGCVLDPFNGSGSTGIAALRLGRSYVGVELEEDWLRLTLERLCDERPAWKAPRLLVSRPLSP